MTGQNLIKLNTFSKWIRLQKTSTPCISKTKHFDKNIDEIPSRITNENTKELIHSSFQYGNSSVSSKRLKTFSRWIRFSDSSTNNAENSKKNIAIKCENFEKDYHFEKGVERRIEKAPSLKSDLILEKKPDPLLSPDFKKIKKFSRWIQISPKYKKYSNQKSTTLRPINKKLGEISDSIHKAVMNSNEKKMDSSDLKSSEKLKMFFTPTDIFPVSEKMNRRIAWDKEETVERSSCNSTNKEKSQSSLTMNSEKFRMYSKWIRLQETNVSTIDEKSHVQVYGESENRNKNFLGSESHIFDEADSFLSIELDSSFDETNFEKPRGSSTPKKKYQSKTFFMEPKQEKSYFHWNNEIENKPNRNLFPILNESMENLCLENKRIKNEGSQNNNIFEKSTGRVLDEDTGELFYVRDSFFQSSSPWTVKIGKNAMKPDWLINCEKKLVEVKLKSK